MSNFVKRMMTEEEAENYVAHVADFLEMCENSKEKDLINYKVQQLSMNLPKIQLNLIKKFGIKNLAQKLANDPDVEATIGKFLGELQERENEEALKLEMSRIPDQKSHPIIWSIDSQANVIHGIIMKIDSTLSNENVKSQAIKEKTLLRDAVMLESKIQHLNAFLTNSKMDTTADVK